MNKGYEAIASILETKYGVGALAADPTTVIWAATQRRVDIVSEGWAFEFAVKQVKNELKKLNRAREKFGKMPVYVPFGHGLF